MPNSSVVLKGRDFSNEPTRLGFDIVLITSANIVAQLALVDTLQAAIDAVSLHVFSGKTVSAVDVQTGVKATDTDAQRERKWRVSYVDATDPIGNGSFEIGMADLTPILPGKEGLMDVSAGVGATLVTAIEAALVSRLGNVITVDSIAHVGRNI